MNVRLACGLTLAALLAACAPSATGPARTISMMPVVAEGTAATVGPGVTGRAVLTSFSNGTTQVAVTLQGMAPNSRHAGHIHVGSCAQQGGVVIPLKDIAAGADGNGSMTAEVKTADIPAAAYVNYHERATGDASGIGGGISCGDIR